MPKIKKFPTKSGLLHQSFEVGVWIKGIDGLLEILGGLLLFWVSPSRLSSMIVLLTQHELSEDPQDLLMNFLLKISHDFSISSQHFGIFYLLSHGITKCILVQFLLRKKSWAYPLTILFLILFIVYQLYRYSYSHSAWLILLTIFDILMIWLTWTEYRRIQKIFQE